MSTVARLERSERVAPASAVTAVAWTATLAATSLWEIVIRAGLGLTVPQWTDAARLATLAALAAAAALTPSLARLRPFLLALVAFAAGSALVDLVEDHGPLAGWFDGARDYQKALADGSLLLVPAALMVATAAAAGFRRRELFLVRGDLRAPAALPRGRRTRWSVLGPALAAIFTVPLALQLALVEGPGSKGASHLLPLLPLGLVFAAVNATGEEIRFRAVPLGCLLDAVEPRQALWMTTVLFGLAHWFGHPSGPTGVVLAGVAGYVWGRAMLETRGLFWPWAIHAVQDVVIFAFLILSSYS